MLLNRLSLRKRLLAVGLLPAALLAAALTTLFLVRSTHSMDSALSERGVAIVSFLAPASEYAVISGNQMTLSSLLQAVLEQPDVVAAAIYDREGSLLAVSGRPRIVNRDAVTNTRSATKLFVSEDRAGFAAPVESAPMFVDDWLEPHLRGAPRAPVESIGWVYVELDTMTLSNNKRDIVLSTVIVLFIGLGLAGVLASRLAGAVNAPLAGLVGAVRRIAGGDLDVRVGEDASSDELRALQLGFNSMANSISQAQKTLQMRIDEATEQLAHQATHDPLTGLPNRRAFEQALEEAIAQSRRAGDRGTLCFIDLDRFKIVNDTCGHAAGDELLQQIARLIRQRVRAEDLICRIGGDEFALILHDCRPEDALRLAESLREAVATFRFTWEGRRFSVGASIGLVRIDGRTSSAADLLVAADLACYSAKKGGRNRVVEYQPDASGGRRKTDIILNNDPPLSGGIPYGRLSLHQQKIVTLGRADVPEWIEILLRTRGADDEIASPKELLASIEPSDKLLELDLWVAEQVCFALSRRAGSSMPTLRFSLNLSAASITQASRYWTRMESLLQTTGMPADRLVVEFRTSIAEQAPDECAQFVREARRVGASIALEKLDGASIGLLRSLRPDYVKISLKTLVESYGLEAGCNLAQALCGMADALDIPTVASEVEDELLRDALHNYGFQHAQGRLISPTEPLPD